ncbi:hypothetical protein [Rhodococcus spongiicola]|uniref:Uncharacterized protein n=1 Tax=Rhodococcus spongiicola TaxID=2487352 RepID=A0A3S3A306_9NOCA|nr:hypothetical protein [Rhodococcus spongiicola]RVW00907.1 hypothetical protein EF834_16140 [Rhodococcus spongiicola]
MITVKFNLGVTTVIAVVTVVTVGQLVADASNQEIRVALLLCIPFAAAVMVWRAQNLSQEPAVFAAVTYLAFLPIQVIAVAIAGDYTRAAIGAVVSPILAAFLVGDPRTRRWLNQKARYPGNNQRDAQK